MATALTDTLGLVAAVCSTAAFVPQVIKTWRSRSAADISLGMLLVLVTGVALWLAYGFLRSDMPLIAANATTLVLVLTILYFKLRHSSTRSAALVRRDPS